MLKQLVKSLAGKLGFEIRRRESKVLMPETKGFETPYLENPEVGAKNLSIKLERVEKGGPFEWPDVLALNRVIVKMLGPAQRITELGGGTGAFAMRTGKSGEERRRRVFGSPPGWG